MIENNVKHILQKIVFFLALKEQKLQRFLFVLNVGGMNRIYFEGMSD